MVFSDIVVIYRVSIEYVLSCLDISDRKVWIRVFGSFLLNRGHCIEQGIHSTVNIWIVLLTVSGEETKSFLLSSLNHELEEVAGDPLAIL